MNVILKVRVYFLGTHGTVRFRVIYINTMEGEDLVECYKHVFKPLVHNVSVMYVIADACRYIIPYDI